MRDDSGVPEPIEFRPLPAGEPPASELIAAMVAELVDLYGPVDDTDRFPSATPQELGPPHGVCIVGFDGAEPVCAGAVKRFEPGVGEIKRMYVAPAGRSRGLARLLLGALEDAARDLGYSRVRLDTGPRQPHARTLYLSAGYTEIGNYNENPAASFWGEKEL